MKGFITIVLFAALSFIAIAQEESDFHYFSAGPFFALKGGSNGGYTPEGRNNAAIFNGLPDFGFTLFYPLGEESDLGLTMDLAYTTYAYKVEGVDVNYDADCKYSYISFAPNMHYNGFIAGLNFGLPVDNSFGDKLSSDKLNFMVEIRLGYFYPLLNDEVGSLNLFLQAGYMLTGIYSDFVKDDPLRTTIPPTFPEKFTNKYNPRAVSILIGLNYLLNL